MASDTVRLWRESGWQARLVHVEDVPNDADAYVFCKCVPRTRPRADALVALHMHDFWDGEAKTLRATIEPLASAPIDVLVPCSEPYEQHLKTLAKDFGLGVRVVWCPENPVFIQSPPRHHPPQDGPFRVGFHGTGSTFKFLTGEPARGLERVAKRYPLEVVILSNFPRTVDEDALKQAMRLKSARVRYVPWTQDGYSAEIACWDAAVLPASHDSDYSIIKSNNRLREVVQHSVPAVVQRGNPDMEWFSGEGHNCPIAGSSEEWFRCTRRILRYRRTRNTYISRSTKMLSTVYGSDAVIERWREVFDL